MHFTFKPKGVCCQQIEFELTPVLALNPEPQHEKDKVEPNCYCVTHIKFTGGCPGNLSFIAKWLTGYNVNYLVSLCKYHRCGNKPTSCMNEFAKCLEEAEKIMNEKEWAPDDCI